MIPMFRDMIHVTNAVLFFYELCTNMQWSSCLYHINQNVLSFSENGIVFSQKIEIKQKEFLKSLNFISPKNHERRVILEILFFNIQNRRLIFGKKNH